MIVHTALFASCPTFTPLSTRHGNPAVKAKVRARMNKTFQIMRVLTY